MRVWCIAPDFLFKSVWERCDRFTGPIEPVAFRKLVHEKFEIWRKKSHFRKFHLISFGIEILTMALVRNINPRVLVYVVIGYRVLIKQVLFELLSQNRWGLYLELKVLQMIDTA